MTISHAVNATLYRNLPYDIIRDFAPVTQLVTDPAVLVVHPSLAAASVTELISLAKAWPDALNYGSGGTGTFTFICRRVVQGSDRREHYARAIQGRRTGVDRRHRWRSRGLFRSVGRRAAAHSAAQITCARCDDAHARALVMELPTVAESGVPGYEAGNWFGLLAPAQNVATDSFEDPYSSDSGV
jgi:tripartite-type tricarboxylate transporter receptor subunit TctC